MKKIFKVLIAIALMASMFSLAACDDFIGFFKTGDSDETDIGNQGDGDDVDDPTSYPIVLYLPNQNADGFITKAAITDGTAEDIVIILVIEGALPAGCEALSFQTTGKTGRVDMNTAFGDAVTNTGSTGEYLRMGSLVNTLLTFFELDEIWVTVNGATLTTGHQIYNYALRFYENQTSGGNTSGGLASMWSTVEGYWISGNFYLGFFIEDGKYRVHFGIMSSGFGLNLEVTDTLYISEFDQEFTLFDAAVPANEFYEGNPDRYFTAHLNRAGLAQSSIAFKISIYLEEWTQFGYAGMSIE